MDQFFQVFESVHLKWMCSVLKGYKEMRQGRVSTIYPIETVLRIEGDVGK